MGQQKGIVSLRVTNSSIPPTEKTYHLDRRAARDIRLCDPRHRVRFFIRGGLLLLMRRLPSLELVVWFVPSLIGGAVAVSLVGVLLGPIYPIVMNESGRILPRWLLTGCIGWIAGLGQAGSAALPFMTGAIASKAGIKSLQPV